MHDIVIPGYVAGMCLSAVFGFMVCVGLVWTIARAARRKP